MVFGLALACTLGGTRAGSITCKQYVMYGYFQAVDGCCPYKAEEMSASVCMLSF